ncbi:hypothetical protein BHT96_12780 [Bacillus licheniformis]|nr:hypothetical protein BHT96_12780 [Bacillus licheniformis]
MSSWKNWFRKHLKSKSETDLTTVYSSGLSFAKTTRNAHSAIYKKELKRVRDLSATDAKMLQMKAISSARQSLTMSQLI